MLFRSANPSGGQVVAGSATITTPTAQSMVINQTTSNAIINWNTFSIGANESVRFNQPSASSIALNRVLGNTRSEIFGQLSANGQIFLVNPNGVLMGRGAEISAAGFLASSLGITDADFLAGRYRFTRGPIAGDVINEGSILTPGGYTALLAPNIINNGLISARLGTVALASGERVTLDLAGDGLIRVAVDEAAGVHVGQARRGACARAARHPWQPRHHGVDSERLPDEQQRQLAAAPEQWASGDQHGDPVGHRQLPDCGNARSEHPQLHAV